VQNDAHLQIERLSVASPVRSLEPERCSREAQEIYQVVQLARLVRPVLENDHVGPCGRIVFQEVSDLVDVIAPS